MPLSSPSSLRTNDHSSCIFQPTPRSFSKLPSTPSTSPSAFSSVSFFFSLLLTYLHRHTAVARLPYHINNSKKTWKALCRDIIMSSLSEHSHSIHGTKSVLGTFQVHGGFNDRMQTGGWCGDIAFLLRLIVLDLSVAQVNWELERR